MRAAGERLKDADLREPVQLLDRLGDHPDQFKLFRCRRDAMQLHDTVREVQLGVSAPDVTPKFVSPSDPAAQWSGAMRGPAFFAYADNYLIDIKFGIIMD